MVRPITVRAATASIGVLPTGLDPHDRGFAGELHLPSPAPVALAGLPPSEGFIGRGEHVATLLDVLGARSSTSVCAIAGLAGVGKTALAVHAAKLALADGWFPGGVLFVDLQQSERLRGRHVCGAAPFVAGISAGVRAAGPGP